MKTNQELKNEALAALKGNWAPAVLAAVLLVVITVVLSIPSYVAEFFAQDVTSYEDVDLTKLMISLMLTQIGGLLSVFLLYPMSIGYAVAHKDLLLYGDASVTRNVIRHSFKGYFRNVLAMLLTYVFTALWMLLLIVPGLVKAYAYAMTPFIIKDYPELSPNKAINLSVKMMDGHKFDLFCLSMSFIGWILLSILTLGVGLVWLMPYMETTVAAFYRDVKEEYMSIEKAI